MIEIVDNLSGLSELEEPWKKLGQSFPSLFLQFEWFYQAAISFAGTDSLRVFVLREDDGVVSALAPFLLLNDRFSSSLVFIGYKQLFEPCGFLYRNQDSLERLADAIVNFGIPLDLNRLSLTSPDGPAVVAAAKRKGFVRQKPELPALWLPVSGDFETYEKSLGSSRRQRLRRALRRAEEFGSIQFEMTKVSVEQVPEVIEILGGVELLSWKGKQGTALTQDSSRWQFFYGYAEKMAQLGCLVFGCLRIAGQPVAVQIAVIFNDTLWVLKIGFDQNFAPCSPGVLLMHRFVRFAFDERLQAVEFAGHYENWLEIWSKKVHKYGTLLSVPLSIKGVSFCAVRALALVKRQFSGQIVSKKREYEA